MFRKLPPGPVNQLNIELNAKNVLFDCLTHWRWEQSSSCDRLFIDILRQNIHQGLSILQTSSKLFYPNVFLWIMIFWIWIGSYWLVTASFFTWKEGNLQHFFKDLPAILSLILQYKVPLGLHQIRIRHETFSLFWGKFRKVHLLMYTPNHCFHFYSITELPYKIH